MKKTRKFSAFFLTIVIFITLALNSAIGVANDPQEQYLPIVIRRTLEQTDRKNVQWLTEQRPLSPLPKGGQPTAN